MLYWVAMRGTWFAAAVVFLVVGLVVWAPLAWASANCAAMGAACEGPCGAASCATVGIPDGPGLPLSGDLLSQDANEPASAVPALIDLPPRSSLLSA